MCRPSISPASVPWVSTSRSATASPSAKPPGRFARLGNRLDTDDLPKIYGALHARIPMVTPDEQRAVQEENAKDDERLWDALRDMSEASAADHKAAHGDRQG